MKGRWLTKDGDENVTTSSSPFCVERYHSLSLRGIFGKLDGSRVLFTMVGFFKFFFGDKFCKKFSFLIDFFHGWNGGFSDKGKTRLYNRN